MPVDPVPSPLDDSGARRASRGLLSLAGARLLAQLLGFGWFLVAARSFGERDFGLLSTGLVLVVVIGGVSDLGLTRTIVRHVAADPRRLRSTYWRAATLRAGAGLVVAVVVLALLPHLISGVPWSILFASAAIAVASGITEIGFAALRSVGALGTEVSALVGERVVFVVLGVVVISAGGGPVEVLCVYAATNAMSALVVGQRVLSRDDGRGAPAGPLLDAEGRHTALSSTLLTIGPRVSALLLVVLATSEAVGTFTIAQKVPEALGIFGIAVLLPVMPVVRSAVVSGRVAEGIERAARITGLVLALATPLAVLACVDGGRVLALLFHAGNRSGAHTAFALLAVAAVVSVVRTFGEIVLLAEERAKRYSVAVGLGLVVNIGVGVVAIKWRSVVGAASASLLAESVVLAAVLVAARHRLLRSVWHHQRPALATAAVAGAVAVAARGLPTMVSASVVVLVGVAGAALVWRAGATAVSALPGDDADVGEVLGGKVSGDGVEAVEYLAGPADHL